MGLLEILSKEKTKRISERISSGILVVILGFSAGICWAPEKVGIVLATEKEFTLDLNDKYVEGELEGEGDTEEGDTEDRDTKVGYSDYYKIVLPSLGWLTVTFQGISIGDAECDVLDANKKALHDYSDLYVSGSSDKDPVTESGTYLLDKGIYYLGVAKDRRSGGTYRVKASFEAPNNNEQEPNNNFLEAVTLKENDKITGFLWDNDCNDYYKVSLSEDRTIKITFSGIYSVITIYDPEKNMVDYFKYDAPRDNPETVTREYEMKKGTNYIQVYSNGGGTYELKWEIITIQISDITIEGSEEMMLGETANFMAAVTPSDAENKKLTWSSSDTSVADVDSNGKVKAKKAGNATITASATDGSGVEGTLDITVVNVPVSQIKITGEKTIKQGRTTQLTATVTPNNATNQKLRWTSADSSVATVDDTGKVTAKKDGTATIRATAKDGSGVTGVFDIKVEKSKIPVTKIKITGNSTVEKGKSVTLKATVTPKNANNKKIKWSSSNTAIATVDSKGKVTAKKAGKVTIKAAAQDGSKVVGSLQITVKKPDVLKKIEEVKTKALGSRKLKITWKKQKAAKQYEIQVAADKKFKKAVLLKTVAGSKDSITVTYKKKGTVYVKVCGISKDGYTGKWSAVKTVKVK